MTSEMNGIVCKVAHFVRDKYSRYSDDFSHICIYKIWISFNLYIVIVLYNKNAIKDAFLYHLIVDL